MVMALPWQLCIVVLLAALAVVVLWQRGAARRDFARAQAAKAKRRAADDLLRERTRQAVDAAKAETSDDDLLSFYAE